MNNKPVAWIAVGDNTSVFFDLDCALAIDENPTPLYTHPAKELDEQFKKGFEAGKEEGWKAHKFHHPAKTLTDEEIEEVRITIMNTAYWCADENMSEAYNAVKVCCSEVLAILRKAQEK